MSLSVSCSAQSLIVSDRRQKSGRLRGHEYVLRHILLNRIYLLDIAKVIDIFLSLDLNFESQALDGFVVLTVEKVDPNAASVVSQSFLLKDKHQVNLACPG